MNRARFAAHLTSKKLETLALAELVVYFKTIAHVHMTQWRQDSKNTEAYWKECR
jgi:hypothetical protein